MLEPRQRAILTSPKNPPTLKLAQKTEGKNALSRELRKGYLIYAK